MERKAGILVRLDVTGANTMGSSNRPVMPAMVSRVNSGIVVRMQGQRPAAYHVDDSVRNSTTRDSGNIAAGNGREESGSV